MLSFLLPLALAAAPPAAAYSAADLTDARCVGVFALMADSTDPEIQKSGIMGTIYFVGKLYGRNPAIDLEAILRSISPAVKKNSAGYLKSCSEELTLVGKALTTAGNALSADGI